MGNQFLRWLPPVLCMGAILVLSSDFGSEEHTGQYLVPILERLLPNLSRETYALLHSIVRTLAHLAEYGILAALWARALAGPGASWQRRHMAGALIIAVFWATADEWHQSFVPSRGPSIVDVGIDAAGALLGVAIGWLFRRDRPGP